MPDMDIAADPSAPAPFRDISPVELALAARNSGMPLEALAEDITPLGLHYLLIHYDIPLIDAASWSLSIEGHVDQPMTFSLDDLRGRPAVTVPVTLECAGNGRALFEQRPVSQPWLYEAVGTALWTGTPLAPLLREAGVRDDTVDYVFTGLDQGVEAGVTQYYERSLGPADALRDDVLIAFEMNGQPLLPQHGHPARLLVPGWYGMASVKWLTKITAILEPFTGHQQTHAYTFRTNREDRGTPLSTIAVRSLMAPPGIPEFPSRVRHVPAGGTVVTGRAWSGAAPIERVEFSDDAGSTWSDADVEPAPAQRAWHRWSIQWRPARSGEHELWCRATDAAGNSQPITPVPNVGGYVGNAVQRVPVVVGD